MKPFLNTLFAITTLAGMLVVSNGFIRRGITYDGFTDGAFYWNVILDFSGVPVADHGLVVDYVWIGRDHEVYLSVSKRDIQNAFVPTVHARIAELIPRIRRQEPAQQTDPELVDLESLSGQSFGDDPAPWRAWWTEHGSTFEPPPDAYDRLKSRRIAAERADIKNGLLSVSLTERLLTRTWPPLWDYRRPWLSPLLKALAVLVVAIILRQILNGSPHPSSSKDPR